MTFVQMRPPEEVADLYAAADINVIPLQKGLIYAALPSKTADCLIAGKPIITCVDEDSKFAKMVGHYRIENTGSIQPEKMIESILKIKQGELKCMDIMMWHDNFMASKSVTAYCDVIEQMG